jgi:hypothetical protein
MTNNIKSIIANKGYEAIIPAIDKSIRDFKNMEYSRGEIKETLRECFYGVDSRIDSYLIMKGY